MAKSQKKSYFSEIDKICNQYGVVSSSDEFCFTIKFNDDKELIYAKPAYYKPKDFLKYILSDVHGRVFKNNAFIGYAPKAKSLEEILIAVDMMV